MSVCVRYVAENKICERFLGFVTLEKLAAEDLFLKIKEFSNSNGLDIKKCIGQAYDGASVMKGHVNGVNVLVRECAENPCIYNHCYSHRLNLVLVDVAKNVNIVDDTFGLLEAIYSFQSVSTLRHQKFKDAQEAQDPYAKQFEIPQQSDTRWVCKYKGVLYFKNNFKAVKSALEDFQNSNNKVEAATAKGFLYQLCNFDIIFVLQVLGEILEHKVSITLQKQDLYMGSAVKVIDALIKVIQDKRSDSFFNETWENACNTCECSNITVPWTANISEEKRQRKPNPKFDSSASVILSTIGQTSSPSGKAKYHQMLYKVLDNMVSELKRRFEHSDYLINAFDAINPSSKNFLHEKYLSGFVEQYSMFLKESELKYEVNLQNHALIGFTGKPLELFIKIQDQTTLYPQLIRLMRFLFTLPVTNTAAERSFSSMKRIKTYLRSTMLTKRLSNLAILSIEKEESGKLIKDPRQIVETFSNVGQRRLML